MPRTICARGVRDVRTPRIETAVLIAAVTSHRPGARIRARRVTTLVRTRVYRPRSGDAERSGGARGSVPPRAMPGTRGALRGPRGGRPRARLDRRAQAGPDGVPRPRDPIGKG